MMTKGCDALMSYDEVWKPVKDFEGYYEVSNFGRIFALPRVDTLGHSRKGHYMKTTKLRNGYLQVALKANGKSLRTAAHRIVATAFLDNPKGYNSVNHIDEDKTNNKVSNLEWCSVLYNNMYNGRNKRVANKLKKPVVVTDREGKATLFDCARAASRSLGLNEGHVSQCLRGELKHHHGYSFAWSV